jgi:hypothetical protein
VRNNLERDSAVLLPALEGQVGDSLTDITPVASFGGEVVIEGAPRRRPYVTWSDR